MLGENTNILKQRASWISYDAYMQWYNIPLQKGVKNISKYHQVYIKWIKQVGEVCVYYATTYLRKKQYLYLSIYHLALNTYTFKNVKINHNFKKIFS